MKFVLYTTSISAHQLPLAREIVKRVCAENFRYIYTGVLQGGGQEVACEEPWVVRKSWSEKLENGEGRSIDEWLEDADVLLSGIRDFALFKRRSARGLKTYYMSERWFKPFRILGVYFFGWFKLVHPRFLNLVVNFRKMLRSDLNFAYLPISINAARDACAIVGSRIRMHDADAKALCVGAHIGAQMNLWGYFVQPSAWAKEDLEILRGRQKTEVCSGVRPLRILWAGRMIALKNVDIIIRALKKVSRFQVKLTLIGDGPERIRLERLADKLELNDKVEFRPFVSIEKMREVMREYDLYVFASNGFDGWGAVVSEALEERMPTLASCECGAGATILPRNCTFSCRDANELAQRIDAFDDLPQLGANGWTAKEAANFLLMEVVK